MRWVPGQPAIKSEGTVFPTTPISIPMPAVTPHNEKGVDPQVVRDLVGLLMKATRKMPIDEPFRQVVLDYLHRKDLQPSPLREGVSS